MRIDLFLNDSYKILNLLYENQTVVLDKKVVLSEKAILLIESMRRTDTKLLKDEN